MSSRYIGVDACVCVYCYVCVSLQFMLVRTQDADESIALEACEFWLSLSEQPMCQNLLMPFIGRLVPVLVRGMKYSENDLLFLQVGRGSGIVGFYRCVLQNDLEEDSHIPDKETDIRPRFHKARTRTASNAEVGE